MRVLINSWQEHRQRLAQLSTTVLKTFILFSSYQECNLTKLLQVLNSNNNDDGDGDDDASTGIVGKCQH